jgi:hypothetical protein
MNRIYHTWDKWECYPAGFYETTCAAFPDDSKDQLEQRYAAFLSDKQAFGAALERVIVEWKNSCEHYLSNENMNRIAWLGQASACIALGLPSDFRGGYNRMTPDQQREADELALATLNKWLARYNDPVLPNLESAASKTEANLY